MAFYLLVYTLPKHAMQNIYHIPRSITSGSETSFLQGKTTNQLKAGFSACISLLY
jgi:hypothetical protein